MKRFIRVENETKAALDLLTATRTRLENFECCNDGTINYLMDSLEKSDPELYNAWVEEWDKLFKAQHKNDLLNHGL